MTDEYMNESMDGSKIALIVFICIFALIILLVGCSNTNYFKNLTYSYKLPTIGKNSSIQMATVPKMKVSNEEPSSEEPSSEEPSFRDGSNLLNLYSNEKRNMNPYGNYKIVGSSTEVKQDSNEIDNLLEHLYQASNSAFIK